MRSSLIALLAVVAAALFAPTTSACDRRPVRNFINNVRPGIIFPKYPSGGVEVQPYVPNAQPPVVPEIVQQSGTTYPGGIIVLPAGSPSCPGGNCPRR